MRWRRRCRTPAAWRRDVSRSSRRNRLGARPAVRSAISSPISRASSARSAVGRRRRTRVSVETAEPKIEIDWGPQSHLIADDSLANLDHIGDDDLAKTLAELSDFERELSAYRHSLHVVLAGLEREIAGRAADDVQ